MFTMLLGGALLGGAAYFAWKMLKALMDMAKNSSGDSEGGGEEGDDSNDGSGSGDAEKKYVKPGSAEDILQQIVNAVRFATTKKVITEEVISLVPTDEMIIRPMNSVAELPGMLPSSQALDDDIFYGMAAGHQLPVREFRETIETQEKKRNLLMVLQDCSGSMKEYESLRMRWSIRLNEKLALRAAREDAEMALIKFSDDPYDTVWARTPAECRSLSLNMSQELFCFNGTNIDGVLERALEVLEEEGFDEARIVLVTDGTEGFSDDLGQKLKSTGVFLHTVCLGQEHEQLRNLSQRYDLLTDQCLLEGENR